MAPIYDTLGVSSQPEVPAFTRTLAINGRRIGPEYPPYVIAEMSGNHNGDIGRTLRILEAAKGAGVDAVKLQTYRPDTITIDHYGPDFVVEGGLWSGQRLYELYEEAHTPWEWHQEIFAYGYELGITVFSSVFDPTAIDFLESLNTPAYKIASPEIIDIPLIRKAARTGKPLIISTGMANLEEIEEAVHAARQEGNNDLVVLHCTAAYPTPPDEVNLATIPDLRKRLGVVVGLSDHTLGTTVATAAIPLGAAVIEKHFTLSRAEGGVDSAFSLEPAELRRLVQDAAIAHAATGTPAYAPTRSEASVLRNRRSLYVVAPIAKGETFTSENVRSIRPGKGMKPKYLDAVTGRKAARDIEFGEPLDVSMIDGGLPI